MRLCAVCVLKGGGKQGVGKKHKLTARESVALRPGDGGADPARPMLRALSAQGTALTAPGASSMSGAGKAAERKMRKLG